LKTPSNPTARRGFIKGVTDMKSDTQLADKLRAKGLTVDTVGDALGEQLKTDVVANVEPPRLEGQPEFPSPGIYFGMPEEVYHSIHACSASGIKKMSTSSMDYWATSPLNTEREDDGDTIAKTMGRAYHCRICEGEKAFLSRYAVALDKTDFGEELCVTVSDLRKAIEACEGKPKGTAKDGLIEQLLDFYPEAKIWDKLVAEHEQANAGKTMISGKLYRRIEIAAAMIGGDPQLKDAFAGGHAEVSVFWYDQRTGAAMKARFDYLKMNHLVDLKSFSNMQGKPVQRAIDMAIASYKYFIPVVVYLEAIEAAKAMIVASKGQCSFQWFHNHETGSAKPIGVGEKAKQWCWEWAHQPTPEVLFVFQQTGIAPVTRGRIMGRGAVFTVTDFAVQFLKRKWVRCAKEYGALPWLDIEPITATVDEDMPFMATDFGDTQ